MPREGNTTASVINFLNSVPGCVAEKVAGSSASSGRADINGCLNGRSFRIEMKSPDHGNKPSMKQEINLRKWRNAGAVVGVCRSLEDVKAVLGIK